MKSLIMPHWSRWHNPNGDEDAFKKWNPRFIKMFFPEGDKAPFLDIALRNAETVILRSWAITENWEHRDGMLTPDDAIYHARQQADAYKAILSWAQSEYGLSQSDMGRIAVETLNEPHLWFNGERPEMLAIHNIEFIKQMSKSGIRTVAMNLGVGWATNHDASGDLLQQNVEAAIPDYSPFLGVFDAIKEHDGWVGLHEYWDYNGAENMWGWWAGRFHALNEYAKDVPLLITESGVDNGVNWKLASDPNVPRGWKSLVRDGRNDDQAEMEYVQQLGWYDQQCILAGNVEGIFPFEFDYQNKEWESFNIRVPTLLDKLYGHMGWITANYPNGFTSQKTPAYNKSVPWFVAQEPSQPPVIPPVEPPVEPPVTPPVEPDPSVDVTALRWNAEQAVRELEGVITDAQSARQRLLDNVLPQLTELENGATASASILSILSRLFGGK